MPIPPRTSIRARQVFGMNADIVGIGIVHEAHRIDIVATFQEGFADAVHTVHYTAIAGKNDGEGQIAIENQACVPDNLPTRQLLGPLIDPKGFCMGRSGAVDRIRLEWRGAMPARSVNSEQWPVSSDKGCRLALACKGRWGRRAVSQKGYTPLDERPDATTCNCPA
jgi:hypothetical protein